MTRKPKNEESFAPRWGDDDLDDKGYVTVPGWILRNYHLFTHEGKQVGITPIEFAFIVHVMSFKWDIVESQAKPSLMTIAERMGRHPTNIHATKRSLMDKGAMDVVSGKSAGKPNIYSFAGLCRQCRIFEAKRYSENTIPTYSENATPGIAKTLHKEYKASTKEKKESARKPKWVNEDALIDVWASIRKLDAIAMGADYHTDSDRRLIKKMLGWPKPLTADEIREVMKRSKHTAYPISFIEKDVLALRAEKPAAVNPAHIQFVPTPDEGEPPPQEALEAMKNLARSMSDKEGFKYAESA